MFEQVGDGLVLMVVGMGMVMLFLAILVAAMQIQAGFFKKFGHLFPEQKAEVKSQKAAGPDLGEVAIAIAVARSRG